MVTSLYPGHSQSHIVFLALVHSKHSKFYLTVSVHLTRDKSTFVTEEVYSKILLRRLSPKLTLKFTARNSNLKSAKFNLSNVNIGTWLNIATLFYQFISEMSLFIISINRLGDWSCLLKWFLYSYYFVKCSNLLLMI